MKTLKYIYFACFCVCISFAHAQEQSNYYSYLMNRVNLNTAYAGSEEQISGILNSRTQWAGVKGAPRNIMFGMHGPIFANQGMGLRIISDTRGSFQTMRSDFMYSHKFYLKENLFFRMGLSAGVINRSLNVVNTQSKSFNENDPMLTNEQYNFTNFVSGFGLLVEWKGLQVGFSAPHMIEDNAIINQHMVGIASYKYDIGEKWQIEPLIIYQNFPILKNQLDAALKGTFAKKVWVQGSYRTNKSFTGAVGFNLKGFGVGYLYEHNSQPLQALSGGTHEIAISFSIVHKPKSFGSLKAEKEMDGMIEYMNQLLNDEKTYGKEFILNEIERIHTELNKLMEKNSNANAGEVKERLPIIEEQINHLIEKYNLKE